jgi:hypothetical protein
MHAMYIAIPMFAGIVHNVLGSDGSDGEGSRKLCWEHSDFQPLAPWSTCHHKSGFIPFSDTVMGACTLSRSLWLSGLWKSMDHVSGFMIVGLLAKEVMIVDGVADGTMTRGGNYPSPHWQVYKDIMLVTCPLCMVVARKCSLVLQPGPRFEGDLPGVLANNSGCVLASGSNGITLMFAIESKDKAGIIQQMITTRRMLMNRTTGEGRVLMCKGNLAAVLCCIEQDKPPRSKSLSRTLSDVAYMAARTSFPPVKRARHGHLAVEQYLPDAPSFCVFQVLFPPALATQLFFTGALIPNNDTHTFVCDFDLDTDGTFVKGSLSEETMMWIDDQKQKAQIRMSEFTLATTIHESKTSGVESGTPVV